ncbi:MAG: hypothetical protein ACYDIA_16475 [Candidatus Humimicrobiaceae bacterium]
MNTQTHQKINGAYYESIYNEILSYINTLEIIDTHEHLPLNEGERDRNIDVIYKNLLV